MKKTFHSVVTLLLVFAMLFGVMAPTVAYAESGIGTGTGTGSSETGSGEGSVGGSYDAGWCVIEYDANELKITLNPDVESLLDMDKERVKEMLNTVIDAAKTIVVDELKDNIMDDFTGGDESLENVSIDDVWQKVIDRYLSTVDGFEGYTSEERYLEFFKMVLASPENEAYYIHGEDGLVDYVCGMLKLAVQGGVFTVEELEDFGEERIRSTVDTLFKTQVADLLSVKVDEYVDTYVSWLLGPAEADLNLDDDIKDFINDEVEGYLADIAGRYINGTLDTGTYICQVISDYVDIKLEQFAKDTLDAYVANGGVSGKGARIDGWIETELKNKIDAQLDAYVDYIYGTGNMPEFYNEIDTAVRAHVGDIDTLPNRAALEDAIEDNYIDIYSSAVTEFYGAYNANKNRFSDLVSDIVNEVLSRGTEFTDVVNNEIENILSSGNAITVLRDILSDTENNSETLISQIKNEILTRTDFDVDVVVPGSFTDRVFLLVLGVSHNEFYNVRLSGYIDAFIADYYTLIDELKNGGDIFDIRNVMSYLESVSVGVHGGSLSMIYGDFGSGYQVSVSAIRSLLSTLPTPAELSEMADGDMCWSYDFLIDTDYGSTDFTLTLEIGGGYDKIRKVAGLVADHLDVYISDDGYYTVNLRVPAKFADVLLRACQTGRISDELKNKIFSLLTYDAEDAYGLFSDKVTFENIIELLERIDFEGLLTKDFIAQYVDLSGLTNEQIVNKVREYEGYFNKAKSIITRVYNKIPEQYLDNEIMDYYESDGQFGFKDTLSVSYETIEKAVMKVLPNYGATLLSFLNLGDSITAKVDLSLDFSDVNRIEYVLPDANEPYRVGLLPVGADVEMFAELTEYNGKQIAYWVERDAAGNQSIITTMPDRDVTIYPVFIEELVITVDKPDVLVRDYNGEAITLKVNIGTFSDYETISYAWYRTSDNQLVSGTDTLSFTGVTAEDSYYYVVTVTKGGATEEYTNIDSAITVEIKTLVIDLSAFTWNKSYFLYDGNVKTVELVSTAQFEFIDIVYGGVYSSAGTSAATTDNYTATATATVKTAHSGNVELTGEITSHDWCITKGAIIASDAEIDYDGSTTITLEAVVPILNEADYDTVEYKWYKMVEGASTFSLGSRSGSDPVLAGSGKTLTLKNVEDSGKYFFVVTATNGSDVETFSSEDNPMQITINPMEIDLSTFVWDRTGFLNNGTERRVSLVDVPEYLHIDYDSNTSSAAGSFTATATARLKTVEEYTDTNYKPSNYTLVNSIAPNEWRISDITVDVSGALEFVYSGTSTTLTVNLGGFTDYQAGELTVAWYRGTDTAPVSTNDTVSITNVVDSGSYYYVVTLSRAGEAEEVYTGDPVTVAVSPVEFDLGSLAWNYEGSFIYDGNVKTVTLLDVPGYLVITYLDNSYSAVGTYTATASWALAAGEDPNNYSIIGSIEPLAWEIILDRVVIPAGLQWSATELVYNGSVQTVQLLIDDALLQQLGVTLTYVVDLDNGITNSATNAGTYTARAVFTSVDGKEVVYENGTGYECEWTINKAQIAITGDFAWDYTAPFVYNGTVFTVKLGNENVDEQVEIVYGGTTSATNAGTYTATVSFVLKAEYTDNYVISEQPTVENLNWEIEKQEIVFTGDYSWNYTVPFIYNGTEFTVKLNNENVDGKVEIVYGGTTSATNAGTYTATVSFVLKDEYTDNYVISEQPVDGTLEWTISPLTVTLADVVWNYTGAFTYNEAEQRVYITGLPTGLNVVYDGITAAVYVGSYQAKAVISVAEGYESNFDLQISEVTLNWQIDKLVVDLSDVDWNYTDALVFNRSEQTVSLSDISAETLALLERAGYTVVLKGNSATNAGKYTATAKIIGVSDNCDVIGFSVDALEWEILKADFDMSGISFPDRTVEYTGEYISVGIIGRLPSEIVVSYTADTSYKYMGIYEITAVFSLANPDDPLVNFDNYNKIAPMTMKLTILSELQNTFNYKSDNGTPIVWVSSENGIPKDHDFKVSDDSHIYTGFFITEDRYGRVIAAYDISFSRDGVYMPVTDNFQVRIRIPGSYSDSENLAVVYINEKGEAEELAFTVLTDEGGDKYVVFKTSHFSTYAIVNIEDAPVKVLPTDYSWIWILVVVLAILLVIAVIIILVIRRRRKNGGDEPEAPVTPDEPTDGGAESETETPVTEQKAEEPAPEAPAEEQKAEEPAPEAPAEEQKAEEPAPVAPAEDEAPEIVVVIGKEPSEETVEAPVPVGEAVPVRYRHSFESKMIQAETDIQDYYTAIKNTLLSYKGVKARISFNYEAFNKGRVQCAKLNLKGRTLMVYLNLNPADYNINKYHFVDITDKIKSEKDKLVMLMKVRSDRALNYTIELIEEMMRVLEIPAGEPQSVDYHMPYESTEALAKRGLVKVILPAGMTLDENSNIVKVNVGELIDSSNAEKTETVTEPAAAADVAAEEEAPAAAEPVVSAEPVEVVYADAKEADKLITDEEAVSHVEVVHTGANQRKGKLGEINLDTICANFEGGETVNLAALRAKGLIGKNVARVKVLARGTMNKSLTVVASKFSMQAIKMIDLAGGSVVIED